MKNFDRMKFDRMGRHVKAGTDPATVVTLEMLQLGRHERVRVKVVDQLPEPWRCPSGAGVSEPLGIVDYQAAPPVEPAPLYAIQSAGPGSSYTLHTLAAPRPVSRWTPALAAWYRANTSVKE